MKSGDVKALLLTALTVMLLALLALLATLQYRWTGQVSNAELERLRSRLNADVARFSREFDGELTRAYLAFASGIPAAPDERSARPEGPRGMEERYALQWERWLGNAPYPRLVSDLFFVASESEGPFRLSHFDPAKGRLEPSAWPPELQGWRTRLAERPSRDGQRGNLPLRGFAEPIAEEIPALIIPLFRNSFFRDGPRPSRPSLIGFSIVKLDRAYLEDSFIATLARQAFPSADDRTDYDLTIVSRARPGTTIYKSNPSLSSAALGSPDAAVTLFSLRFDALPGPQREGSSQGIGRPRDSFRQRELPPAPGFGRRGRGLAPPPQEGRWELIVKHRGGSLETVVGAARRRNLVVSFTILLLLACSMALIIVSTQRAQRLVRQQMDFVAGISHELRTPLAVICSAGDNLADGLIDGRRQVEQYGALIRNEGRRLTGMVEQILEFAGIRSGKALYEMRPVDVGQILRDAREACEPQIREAGFHVETEIEPELPQVQADAAALTRAVQNLFSNAIKYGGESRWIGFRAMAGAGERGPEVQITVQDRGPGIAPADLPHIFNPFYRGRQAVSAQIRGNGLGLNLVKNIVEAHGGCVTVASSPGQGSSFTIHLPSCALLIDRKSQIADRK